jgi:FMN phosphatase YigB (HAD superfamily)
MNPQVFFRLSFALALAVAVAGCAAARSTYYLYEAVDVQKKAAAAGADGAVYEWTLATEFLRKAREEAGYSDYEQAETLAREAVEWTRRAEAAVDMGVTSRQEKIEEMVEEAVEDVPDEFVEPVQDDRPGSDITIKEYEDIDDMIDFLEEDE